MPWCANTEKILHMNTDENMNIIDHLLDEATCLVFYQLSHILVKTFDTLLIH